MADEVNNIDSAPNHLPRTDWQILGELQLQVGSELDDTIQQWLTKILSTFSMPNDFVSKIGKSVKEAALRVLSPEASKVKFEHLEVVVLVPTELISPGKTWGFFRVEKTSTDISHENANGHSIEYYIYLDINSDGQRRTP